MFPDRKIMQRILLLLLPLLFSLYHPLAASASEITVKEGQGLRDIASEHLGDPDLWPEILRVNGLTSPGEIKTGMRLKLPGDIIGKVTKTIAKSKKLISEATEQGARLFAPKSISQATQLLQKAIKLRKKSEWDASLDAAANSVSSAETALSKTQSMRDSAAQAILDERTGSVQSRKAKDLAWNSIKRQAVLLEKEKVRTLSDSWAGIIFVDDSRLRLSPNSQAQIQSMRIDKLTKAKKVNVTLTGGDVHALLGGSGKKKTLKLNVPGVSVDSNSTNFWVGKSKNSTKFANYDNTDMKVSSAGESVVLKKNQGTVVGQDQAPSQVVDLLPPPRGLKPANDTAVYEHQVTLSWQPIKGVLKHRLEVSKKSTFDTMLRMLPEITGTKFVLENLPPGVLYWRVASINDLEIPGAFCATRRFRVMEDTNAPQIIVRSPREGAILRQSEVTVKGTVETCASFTINGTTVNTETNGAFLHTVKLSEGDNEIVLVTSDKAGNESRMIRIVRFMPDMSGEVRYSSDLVAVEEHHFATRNKALILAGVTRPKARITIKGQDGTEAGVTRSDEQGRFQVKLAVSEQAQVYTLEVKTASGFSFSETITLSRDLRPPEITLDSKPPVITAIPELTVQGRVQEGSSLQLNGKPVSLDNERFVIKLDLHEGSNPFILSAADAVGNESRLLRTIILDMTPPELIKAEVSPKKAGAGETVRVTVQARDNNALKPAAAATISINQHRQSVRLQLDAGASSYRGVVRLDAGKQKSAVQILDVLLEDRVGNRKKYTP